MLSNSGQGLGDLTRMRYGVKPSASQMITVMKNTDYTDELDLPMKKLFLTEFDYSDSNKRLQ